MNSERNSLYRLSNLLVLKVNHRNLILSVSESLAASFNKTVDEMIGEDFTTIFNNQLSELLFSAKNENKIAEKKGIGIGINNVKADVSIIPEDDNTSTIIFTGLEYSVNNGCKYSGIFNSTPDSLILYNVDTEKVVDCNRAALEMFGYESDEIIDLSPNDISAEPEESLAVLREAHEGYKVKIPIRFLKRKDGTVFPAELYSNFFSDSGQDLLCVAIRDISERHLFDNKLREKDEHLISLINATPDIICIKDGEGKWLMANDADIDLFNLNEIDYVGKTDAELAELSPHFRDAFLSCIDSDEKAWSEGILCRGDETIIKITGQKKVYDVIKVPLFNQDGSRKSLIVFGRDITRRKEVEERLNSIAEQYKSLYENAAVGVYRSTVNGKPVLANKAFLDILGFNTFEEFARYNTVHLYKDKTARRQFIELARKHDVIKGFETELIKRDGSVVNVRMNAHVFKNSENEIEYFEGMVEDISEKRRYEQILIKAKEEAEKSDKLKSEFLAQMSHEIRTPINSLLNSVGLIKEELFKKINDDIQSCFSIIDSSSHRIIRTIDSILNMSEIQTGTYDLQLVEIDLLRDILKPLMSEFRFLAESKGLKFTLECNEKNTLLDLDEYGVKQIFTNLIDNAIKFTNKGEIHVKLFRNTAGCLNVEIKDSGIGISRDYLPDLFKPFTQEQQGYTRKYEGNGLGLALVAKFCEFNSASITVDSEKGKGSLFRVNFNK